MALHKTHAEVMQLPIDEINKWRAYFSLQPFGFYREEFLNSKLCNVIQSSAGKTFKDVPSIKDHMGYTNAMYDHANPRKRIAEKVRAVMGMFKHGY